MRIAQTANAAALKNRGATPSHGEERDGQYGDVEGL